MPTQSFSKYDGKLILSGAKTKAGSGYNSTCFNPSLLVIYSYVNDSLTVINEHSESALNFSEV